MEPGTVVTMKKEIWQKMIFKGSWSNCKFLYFVDAPKIRLLKFLIISELGLNPAITLVTMAK